MNLLEQKIINEGTVKPGNVLLIDNFLNHQIDIEVMREIAKEFKRRFADVEITKILTIESSGIAIATMVGHYLDVPVIFAKKDNILTNPEKKYISQAISFTRKVVNRIAVTAAYLDAKEKVLIIDDFLAEGEASRALINIVKQAGATVAGIGIAVEKGYMKGGAELRAEGYRVESIAIVDDMDYHTQTIHLRQQ